MSSKSVIVAPPEDECTIKPAQAGPEATLLVPFRWGGGSTSLWMSKRSSSGLCLVFNNLEEVLILRECPTLL